MKNLWRFYGFLIFYFFCYMLAALFFYDKDMPLLEKVGWSYLAAFGVMLFIAVFAVLVIVGVARMLGEIFGPLAGSFSQLFKEDEGYIDVYKKKETYEEPYSDSYSEPRRRYHRPKKKPVYHNEKSWHPPQQQQLENLGCTAMLVLILLVLLVWL